MAQQIINYGAAPDDGTGDALREAFIKVDENFNQIWNAGPVGSNVVINNNEISVVDTNGNLVLSPNGTGYVQLNNNTIPRANNTYTLGSPNLYFRGAYFGTGGMFVLGNITVGGQIIGNFSFGNTIVANIAGNVYSTLDGSLLLNAQNNSLSVSTANIGNLNIAHDAVITGNLTVQGNTTFINIENFNVEDPIIGIGRGANNTPLTSNDGRDRGEQLWYYTNSEKSAFIGYQNASGNLIAATDVTIGNEIVTVNSYGNFVTGNVFGERAEFSGNITGNGLISTANLFVQGTADVFNLQTIGYANLDTVSVATMANIGGNLNTNNVINTGIVTSTGNITAPNFVGNLVGNISGNIAAPGANTDVLFNDNGVANATSGLTFNKNTNLLSVTGNVSASYYAGAGNLLTGVMADRGADTNNWNTLTQMGVYKVNRSSWSGVTGAPLDSTVFVGVLQVTTSTDATTQVFFPGSVSPSDVKIQWTRSLWSGSWTDWYKMINNGQTIDAGAF